jgi:galactokinase/mevalonate kinase-like predicted kinase
MFPNMLNKEILSKINIYKDKCIGYKISGAGGGGYLILVSDKEIKNAIKIKIRRKNNF